MPILFFLSLHQVQNSYTHNLHPNNIITHTHTHTHTHTSINYSHHPCGGFPGGSDSKESTCNAGDLDSIPGSGRAPGEGDGNPLQYCLENSMDRGTWQATVHGVAKSQTQLSY